MFKVLLICSGLGPGGKERQLIEMARNLGNYQIECGIITFNQEQHYTKEAKKYSSYFRELRKRPTRLEPFFSIWKCIREYKPDIIHTWDPISSLYALIPGKVLGIPLLNGSIRDAGVEKGLSFQLKKFLLGMADQVVSNSKAGLHAYQTKGHVIYNSIDTKRFKAEDQTAEFNLLMTANFTKYKDHYSFLKASVQLLQEGIIDQVYLLGDGQGKAKVQLWLNQNYPQYETKIHFTGAVRNVEDYLPLCKAGVLCSTKEYSEGLSNAVLEYMAAGLVPIVTDLGGSSEIVEQGKNGFLVEAGNTIQIVDAIKKLKSDSNLYSRLSSTAKMTIQQKFSLEANLSELIELYRSMDR